MIARQTNSMSREFESLLANHALGEWSDANLLERFLQSRDEAAFEVLVNRHGPMVLRVCRALLRNAADAEDAFQATFLVLACRAGRIRSRSSLASFLYGTAHRVAMKLRSRELRLRLLESAMAKAHASNDESEPIGRDEVALVHEELARLPKRYRQAIVLCHLQGRTHEQAAKDLHLPVGSVSRRLQRACELLRERLIGRGLAPAFAAVAVADLAASPALVVPVTLVSATTNAVGSCLNRSMQVAGAHAPSIELAREVLRTMRTFKLMLSGAIVSFVAIVAFGLTLLASEKTTPPNDKGQAVLKPEFEASFLAPEQPADAKTRFETLAKDLKMFPTGEFAYGRGNRADWMIPPKWSAPWHKTYAAIMADPATIEELIALLKHKDHNVRLLALATLYERNDPKILPEIAALMKDNETTVPEVAIRRALMFVKKDFDLLPQDMHVQTVGRVATVLLDNWLQPAGYRTNDFAKYWELRKDRKFCASWFLVRFYRAAQATSAFDPKRAPIIQAIRKEVDALPVIDREWTLLWLAANQLIGSEEATRAFAQPKELLDAGARLGPDKLMDLIQNKEISADPDLAPNQIRTRVRDDLVLWVLRNAGKLLRPKDAPTLLEVESKVRDRTPWCALAAAELQPDKARTWLREAIGRFGKNPSDSWPRAELAAGLWRIVGDGEITYLVDWFYGEKVDRNPHTTQTEIFLDRVKGVRAPADRKLLAKLVADERFDKLDHYSLRAITEVINAWTKQPVVPFEKLRPNWERGGWFPETPRDSQLLADWREKVKKSMAEWSPKSK